MGVYLLNQPAQSQTMQIFPGQASCVFCLGSARMTAEMSPCPLLLCGKSLAGSGRGPGSPALEFGASFAVGSFGSSIDSDDSMQVFNDLALGQGCYHTFQEVATSLRRRSECICFKRQKHQSHRRGQDQLQIIRIRRKQREFAAAGSNCTKAAKSEDNF